MSRLRRAVIDTNSRRLRICVSRRRAVDANVIPPARRLRARAKLTV
jgi:hypothetical protein